MFKVEAVNLGALASGTELSHAEALESYLNAQEAKGLHLIAVEGTFFIFAVFTVDDAEPELGFDGEPVVPVVPPTQPETA